MITKNNYFILTGAMGAGKSTVLNQLMNSEYNCIAEPARPVLKEQRSINGDGVPEKNPEMFNRLMLSKMIVDYEKNINSDEIFIFDRGLPDLIAYAELFKIDKTPYLKASADNRYNQTVFMFNPWEEIYCTDDERKMSYILSKQFGENVKDIYNSLGYNLIDVPFIPAQERAEFISEKLKVLI